MPSHWNRRMRGLPQAAAAFAGVLGLLMTSVAGAQDIVPFLARGFDDPWTLQGAPNFSWGGWMQVGVQDLPDGAFTGNGPFLNQKEWGNLNLNQAYVFAEKGTDGSTGLDWGFRFDSMYGVDGNEGQAFGGPPGRWDFMNGFDHGIYEFAFPQAYGEVALGDVSVKVGHFYTIIGYEVVTSPDNFFLSRQLTFYNSEPFTHTGALGTVNLTENFSATGGWVLGWDTAFDNLNSGNSFMGGITWNIGDYVTFISAMAAGNFGWRGDGAISSSILSVQLTDRLSTVVQGDILDTNLPAKFQDPASFTAQNSTGLIGYTFYELTDMLALGYRGEWYKADGTSYYTNTFGVNVKPHANLIFRPEVRINDSPGDPNSVFNSTILGVDGIFLF